MFNGRQCGLIDIGSCNVPARREAGFIEGYRTLRIGDDAITVTDYDNEAGKGDHRNGRDTMNEYRFRTLSICSPISGRTLRRC